MLKIGITGGIGSGKSFVSKIFSEMGIPVYYADNRAKKLMVTHEELIDEIKSIFGKKAYFDDGSLNRKFLGEIVFSDKEKLQLLNEAVHPILHQDGDLWHLNQKNVPFTLREAAILVESNGHLSMDKVIVVDAPLMLRVQRVMARDQVSKKQVMARMNNQIQDDLRLKFAHYFIENDGKLDVRKQIEEIYKSISST